MTAADSVGHAPPFYRFMGFCVDAADDVARVQLPFRPEFSNSRGEVHGGAIASLLDVALSRAVRLHHRDITGLATIGVAVHFLSPARGDLEGRATVISRGKTVAVAEAVVIDSTGEEVARATGTFRLFRKKAQEGV